MQPIFKILCLTLSVGDHVLICIFGESQSRSLTENPVTPLGSCSLLFVELEQGEMGRSPQERDASEWLLQPPKIPETDDRFPQGTFSKMFVCPNDRYFLFASSYLTVQPKEDFFSVSLFYKALRVRNSMLHLFNFFIKYFAFHNFPPPQITPSKISIKSSAWERYFKLFALH